MKGCSDNLAGSPDFRTEVTQEADGTFRATCRSNVQVEDVVAPTAKEATREMERRLQAWFLTGGAAKEGGR